MTTVRQIEKLLNAGARPQLLNSLLMGRPESNPKLQLLLNKPLAVAALTLLRLDELSQTHVPLYGRTLGQILAAQEADGGWGDPILTALCLRALMAGRGAGASVASGLKYLADLQKDDGLWPAEPIRRLAADPFVSAFILLELGGQPLFREAVQFDQAVNWFRLHNASLDRDTQNLWLHASLRCRTAGRVFTEVPEFQWG